MNRLRFLCPGQKATRAYSLPGEPESYFKDSSENTGKSDSEIGGSLIEGAPTVLLGGTLINAGLEGRCFGKRFPSLAGC